MSINTFHSLLYIKISKSCQELGSTTCENAKWEKNWKCSCKCSIQDPKFNIACPLLAGQAGGWADANSVCTGSFSETFAIWFVEVEWEGRKSQNLSLNVKRVVSVGETILNLKLPG